MTQVGILSEIWPEPLGNHSVFSLCSGYILPYIPSLVIIQMQYRHYMVFVLGRDKGFTVKYTPSPEGVPKGKA